MNSWPLEREELLRKLWADRLTVLQISQRFGCTKNSIHGKLTRLGLIAKKEMPTKREAPLPRAKFNPSFKKPGGVPGRRPDTVFGQPNTIKAWKPPSLTPEQKRIVLDGERSTGVPLNDSVMEIVGHGKQATLRWSGGLQPGQCKWVINAQERGGEYLFCGEKALSGCVYCGEHERRACA